MMASKAQIRAQSKYDKNNTKQVVLKLNVNHDADILARLADRKNKQGYIKALVRSDMRDSENGILSLESIRYLLLPTAKKYALRSLSVFGSYARNEARSDSDVDILIDGGNYRGLIGYMDMIDAMKAALGKEVDVVTQASLDGSRTKSELIFKNNIERDKVVLI